MQLLDEKISSPSYEERFPEKIKFLPVAFVLGIIAGLYWIYVRFHLEPRLEDPETAESAWLQAIVFHVVTVMLLLCYTLSVMVHPGSIPNKDEDPSWEYLPGEAAQPQPILADSSIVQIQESKKCGDRRNCKWCNKYKPDRCHHCRTCRMCILKMDHHCPWIYNCVGFRNYKYFFLLLLYTTIDCNFIVWTMSSSVRSGTAPSTPFMTMFLLLFGETLATFLGALVTLFFGFHIYLMFKAMTTIEFCEKSQRRGGFDSSTYDRGMVGNMKAVLGENPLLWLLPIAGPSGRGLSFVTEDMRLTKDMEVGRGMRRRAHQKGEAQKNVAPKRRVERPHMTGGGTGSTGHSEEDSYTSGSEEASTLHPTESPEPDVGSSSTRHALPEAGNKAA